MSHEMNEFTKKVSSTLLKNTTGFVLKKIQCLTASVFFFFFYFILFAIDKGNSCLFETCVKLQLQTQ